MVRKKRYSYIPLKVMSRTVDILNERRNNTYTRRTRNISDTMIGNTLGTPHQKMGVSTAQLPNHTSRMRDPRRVHHELETKGRQEYCHKFAQLVLMTDPATILDAHRPDWHRHTTLVETSDHLQHSVNSVASDQTWAIKPSLWSRDCTRIDQHAAVGNGHEELVE